MTNQRNTHTTNMSASGQQSAGDFRPPLTSDHSIVQLAAASLLHEVDSAAELKRSQRLKEEIDRIKSSIPTKSTSVVPQVVDQQQASSTTADTFRARRSRRKADNQQQQPILTQTQPQVFGAPLASLDLSISTETPSDSLLVHLGQVAGDSNNPQQQSSSSSSATFETPTLSGYLDCDELSDMVDDSLFEITNAGCLSRSVFSRAPVASSSAHSQLQITTTTTTTTTSKTSQRQEQQEGEKTPTNEQAIEEKVSNNNHDSKRPVVMSRVGQGGVVQSVTSTSTSSATKSTIKLNNQPQNFHMQHQAHDYSSTSSVPSQIRSSSLSASQLKSTSQSDSSRQSSSSSGRRRSKTTRSPTSGGRPGGGAEELNEAAADDDSSTTTDNNDDSPHSTLPNTRRGLPGHSQVTLAKTHQPAAQQVRPATKKRSQSNSTLNASELEQNINRRCPICCEQQELKSGQSSTPTGKKTSGKRRFTFSLFNLFTNGPQQPSSVSRTADDNANSIATCQHHLKQNSISRLASKSVPAPVTSSKQTSPSSMHHHKRQTASNSATTTSRMRTSNNQQEPRPPMRLRDSIKITNQRKQRQSINNNNKTKTSRQSSREQADEVLLDLSCTVGPRPSATLRNSAGGQQKPHSNSTTTIKSKSVKFTTPDRVLILSPAPQIVDDELDSGGHLSRSSGRAQGHNLSSSSSHLANLPGLHQTTARPDSQVPTPIIKRSPNINQNQGQTYRQLVAKSSSYSQTEPNKGLDELLAKYEQNNKIVAEINEKLQLTETISSNKTALDTSTSLSLEEDEEAPTSDHNGEQQVNSGGEPQVDIEQQQTQTQLAPSSLEDDVDEELLEVIQRQFDAFDLMSPTAAAAASAIQCPEEQLDEDFSHCDCNNIDKQKQEQYLRRLNEANHQIKEEYHQSDVSRAVADSIGRVAVTSRRHDDDTEDEGAKQLPLIISDKDGRRKSAGSSATREAASDLHLKSEKKTTMRKFHDDGTASSSASSSSLSLVAAARADKPLVTRGQAKVAAENDGDEEEEASGFSRDWLSKQSKALG